MYTRTVFIAATILLVNTVTAAPAPSMAKYATSNTPSCVSNTTSTSSSPLITQTTVASIIPGAPAASSTPLVSITPTTSNTPATSSTPGTSTNPSGLTLFQQLTLAPNAVERLALLQDSDFIFNFQDPTRTAGVTTGLGGKLVRADHATFPALVAQGGAVTIGFLGPCGFNTPHVHPRAAELNLVIQGRLFASVTAENGARHMNHTLNQYEMTVFPQGALHTEFNPDCTEAVFVASFPNEDPGVGQIAQEFLGLENQIIKGSLGGEVVVDGKDIDAFRELIPANVAKGVDSCLAKCGIAKR